MKQGDPLIVVGGSCRMGLAAARLARDEGAEVVVAGRPQERLIQAR